MSVARIGLRARILAVNLFALIVLAGGLLYLDNYRERLVDQRRQQLRQEARLVALNLTGADFFDHATGMPAIEPARRAKLVAAARLTSTRLIVFDKGGSIALDSWSVTGPNFEIGNPADDPRRRKIARVLDEVIDTILSTREVPRFEPSRPAIGRKWPEIRRAYQDRSVVDTVWYAPDRTLIVTVAVPVAPGGLPIPANDPQDVGVLHLTADASDITFRVRDERLRAFRLFLGVLALTTLLSSYLARTIVDPLARLASAAGLVRSGRERTVVVPRLPRRADEIGQLARAISDMTAALRTRIDATEAFAAEVAHELKNPLASLRSALETFPKVPDAKRRSALLSVMADDVARLDRLIGDIAEASRLEAEISRARFAPVDLAALAAEMASATARGRGVRLVTQGAATAMGDAARLRQVAQNLVDNAVSFSPEGGSVRILVERHGGRALLIVEDEGPGVPPEAVERIFERFYTQRPEGEAFGRHSGLGLAIARAIVEAHGGTIVAANRPGRGARFTVSLAAA